MIQPRHSKFKSPVINLFSTFILLFFFTLAQLPLLAQTGPHEKIFYNGKIFTASDSLPIAEAVSIRGQRIVAVGILQDVRASVSARAELIDLEGQCLLPGLVDSHNHAIGGGESLLSATLNDAFLTKEELRDFAKKTLESKRGMHGDVLFIGGVHSSTWAEVETLNDLFNREPYLNQAVVLRGSDKHTAWVNNVVIRRASIDGSFIKSLSPAEKKYFGVNKYSEPNGLISESGFRKIEAILPSSPIKPIQAAEAGVKHLNSLGITAWLDPSAGNVSEGLNNHILTIYKELSAQKKLTAHVATVVVANGNSDGLQQVEVVKKLQHQFASVSNISILGFKIFADGVLEFPTQTAAVSIPYTNSNQLGSLMFDPQKFRKFVVLADRENLLVHVHAIGDRAVTESLDAFGSARRANGNSTIPHSITHLQLVKPQDFARFSALNVLASMQLLWASADSYTMDLVKPYLDPQLFAHQYPAMSLLNAGCIVAGASDWPVSSANPFDAIHMAETRKGQKGILDPKEIMPRIEMLKAYTIRAARVLMQEKNIGSIERGKNADFVLLDRDVLTVSSDDIKETKVLWTMFAGEIVYRN